MVNSNKKGRGTEGAGHTFCHLLFILRVAACTIVFVPGGGGGFSRGGIQRYRRQTRVHFISSPLLGLPRFRHAPKPTRATAVGSEMRICPRGHRAYYEQQRMATQLHIFRNTHTAI